jgi:hypothetical protein
VNFCLALVTTRADIAKSDCLFYFIAAETVAQ